MSFHWAAAPDKLATTLNDECPFEGGVAVTREMYKAALAALTDATDPRVIVIEGGDVALAVPPEPEPPTPEPMSLPAYAAEKRRALANGATVVDVGNGRLVPVWTDPESRSSILGLVAAAGIDPQTTTNWKGADGTFYALNAGEITALGFGVRSWVQACFDAEAAVLAAIGNETITTFGEIDAANWPSND